MSLSFLVPAFFVGLLALGIPIAIHLIRRDTRDPVQFPSFMFLDKVPQKRNEKRRIHRWPLFLLRSLAVLLLVLAFARPFLDRGEAASVLATSGDREVVVLLDRSYSMALGDRWDRAVAAATEVVDGLSGGDRGTVVFFDSGAETTSESTTDRNVLRTALRNADPGPRTTRYAPALRYAARILSSSPLPRHELVVISDFQRGGWDADGGETASLRIPQGTSISTVSVSDAESGVNLSIESADFERESVAGRERVTVTARLTSNGVVSGEVPMVLEVDGREIETRTVTFGEGNSATISFAALTLPEEGITRGTLRIPEDQLPPDNTFHFVLSSDQRIPVLVIEGAGSSSYFLERALSIGGTPGFRPEIRRGGELRAVDLQSSPVVILNQTPFPSGVQGDRLREYIQQGGGVVMLLGTNSPGDWSGVLPNIAGPVDRSRDGGITLGYVDLGHPVFEAFAGPRSGDFSSARFYRYRPLPSDAFPRVLARFGDGGAALAERPVGNGRILLWTSTLDTDWNDLTLQPVFLPFLHQMVKYAAGHEPPRSWMTVGDPLDARGLLPTGEQSGVVITPSTSRIDVTAGAPIELSDVGFYELRDASGSTRLASYAVNVDPSESELSVFDPEEMRTALLAAASATPDATSQVGLTLTERERRQNGWWYLMIGVFILLAAETLFSNGLIDARGTFARWRGAAKSG